MNTPSMATGTSYFMVLVFQSFKHSNVRIIKILSSKQLSGMLGSSRCFEKRGPKYPSWIPELARLRIYKWNSLTQRSFFTMIKFQFLLLRRLFTVRIRCIRFWTLDTIYSTPSPPPLQRMLSTALLTMCCWLREVRVENRIDAQIAP